MSIIEFAVPVWHSRFTQQDSTSIERVQKIAISVILNEPYSSYESSLAKSKLKELSLRRDKLCRKFSQKELTKPISLFSHRKQTYSTRSKQLIREPQCRTLNYYNSTLSLKTSQQS